MAEYQAEPFSVALNVLRDRLRLGLLGPGARITAMDVADELRLSTTPVREALSRLAGEGLVDDRKGQGYFVRTLSAGDVADLYRLSLAHLLIALAPRRASRMTGAKEAAAPDLDPVARTETEFRKWVAQTGSRVLIREFRTLQIQLGPVRRLEGRIIPNLEVEAEGLLVRAQHASRGEWLSQLRQFHSRRIREAARLASYLEARNGTPRK
ncbi:GntR family transcriptional regulator [Phenylobacterium sp.]|jgi:DNA-binding GntR family transcriptional regulator|uniref:GntR family transcriptional regulator n=1 Tax=Phenylobacterium sp. TaxID=1871053 RepID=UPI002E36981E|nr:GntR family transcriptional regulator [Phenylobacterium sp.]HEX3365703.1 GntR family transcriptional regulator [Phenylobacterium sp.]